MYNIPENRTLFYIHGIYNTIIIHVFYTYFVSYIYIFICLLVFFMNDYYISLIQIEYIFYNVCSSIRLILFYENKNFLLGANKVFLMF